MHLPAGRQVKKFRECRARMNNTVGQVEKEKLFDTHREKRVSGEFFSFSGISRILAFFMSAVAFLNTFSATGKSISRLERLYIIHNYTHSFQKDIEYFFVYR